MSEPIAYYQDLIKLLQAQLHTSVNSARNGPRLKQKVDAYNDVGIDRQLGNTTDREPVDQRHRKARGNVVKIQFLALAIERRFGYRRREKKVIQATESR